MKATGFENWLLWAGANSSTSHQGAVYRSKLDCVLSSCAASYMLVRRTCLAVAYSTISAGSSFVIRSSQTICLKRTLLCFVVNMLAGKYKVVMDSDAWHFGGAGRVHWDGEHFTTPAEDGKFNDRDQFFQVRATCQHAAYGLNIQVKNR